MQTSRKKSAARPAKDMTPQLERFKAMARDIGADESLEAFDDTLMRIAPGKPAPLPKPNKRRKKAAQAK